jgi:hypothetical protein
LKEQDYPGDLIFLSAIVGAIAAPIKLLFHHIFMWLNLSSGFYNELTAYLVHGHHAAKGMAEMIFAEMGDIAIGAGLGIILGLWLKNAHPKYHWWIGLGYGIGIWFLTLVFGNLTKIIKPEMTTPWSLFAHLLAMFLYGLLFVLATKIWSPLRKKVIES